MSVKIGILIGVLLLLSVVIAGMIIFTIRINETMPGIAKTAEAEIRVTMVTSTPQPTIMPYPSITPLSPLVTQSTENDSLILPTQVNK